ncbi:hypothetical protein PTI98_013649 [Pleurotus ostreatus]|nr:hypothetical protein PTI98_013649 [Pleurotus ostreatus]
MLADHPNQPFVRSVMRGLREGFWPIDDGEWKIELEEISDNPVSNEEDLIALRAYRDKEVAAGRWSESLPSLHPKMKVSPMFVVWQKGKGRIITDHSASGLNDGIPREEGRVKYDDMRPFGQCLLDAKLKYPGRRIVTFKDDVASAFLNVPAHPLWQLRQVVVVDGIYYIVRRLVFGNRASPRIWCSISGLICWIAVRKLGISSLHVFMDDFFGWDFADNLMLFRGKLRPRQQVWLLLLWDRINCPWEEKKQSFGDIQKIIGFWVDANVGSISLSPGSVADILEKISSFLNTHDRAPILREWQRLTGHLNWAINVLPWGRPALSELYRKMSGKEHPKRPIFINREVRESLSWLSDVIPRSIGVHFIDALRWKDSDADMVMWTDASLRNALAYTYAGNAFVYQIRENQTRYVIDIFFLEMVAILSAVHHAASLTTPPRRLLIFTDSLDSVGILNSLAAHEPLHNAPLKAIASIVLTTGVDLQARHIPGKENIKADLLSRLLFDDYKRQFPADKISSFSPPRDLLDERWRNTF